MHPTKTTEMTRKPNEPHCTRTHARTVTTVPHASFHATTTQPRLIMIVPDIAGVPVITCRAWNSIQLEFVAFPDGCGSDDQEHCNASTGIQQH